MSITVSEALLECCQMMEEEAHQEEAIPEEPEEESSDMEMADDKGHDDPEPPDPNEEADEGVTAPPPRGCRPYPSGTWWCHHGRGGCPPHAGHISSRRSSCWTSEP